ncbi:Phosphoenolpyruvate carboxykinase [GTP] [uncultured archaeon]|nr:Phosphoenolpyruvate carboxykinase [GTP] [uncultured archaeon]
MNVDPSILSKENTEKLKALNNPHVMHIVEEYAKICKPNKITVLTDSKQDVEYARTIALEKGEEAKLKMAGHTVHFDGPKDQGRDKENTKILVPKGVKLSKSINTGEREECLTEVMGILDGIMKGKEMFVSFFCLGPENSKFSLCALQLTDSAYVAHSENILYRSGYREFKRLKGSDKFFYFIHSAGELNERGQTKNVDKRRIYIDLEGNRVLTINNQYAGNSVGLKKLALRLAIKKANNEDWLCEHMFLMGVLPKGKGRKTYFAGAFPSGCGKTSTAMIPGQTIVGDDIAYLRVGDDGRAYSVNVEQGIFGIIENVNADDDPLIFETLKTPRELIFSNVLVKDGVPYWLGMGEETPKEGLNYAGEWKAGMIDAKGKPVLLAHKNARYTMRLSELPNVDPELHNPNGVPVDGIIYGGRDSDTSPPVAQSLSWSHGVFMGAAVESETTAQVLGAEGVRTHDPMANMDFLVVPLATYIENHISFGERLDKTPKVFTTNYFLKKDGKFLNGKLDKKVWLLWMEGRVHNEYSALETPIGYIPKYEDLKKLFKEALNKEYSMESYIQQFSIRITKLLQKLDRIEAIYLEEGAPEVFHEHLKQQRSRLLDAQKKHNKEEISPLDL